MLVEASLGIVSIHNHLFVAGWSEESIEVSHAANFSHAQEQVLDRVWPKVKHFVTPPRAPFHA